MRQKRKRNRKPKPKEFYAVMPIAWALDPRYSNAALAVYAVLDVMVLQSSCPDKRTAPFTIGAIGKAAGIAWQTAKAGLADLERLGAVTVDREAGTFSLWKSRDRIIKEGRWRKVRINRAWRGLGIAARRFLFRLRGIGKIGKVWASQATIAEKCGCSIAQAQRHLDTLRKAGIVWRDLRKGWIYGGRQAGRIITTNLYTLFPDAEAIRQTQAKVREVWTDYLVGFRRVAGTFSRPRRAARSREAVEAEVAESAAFKARMKDILATT